MGIGHEAIAQTTLLGETTQLEALVTNVRKGHHMRGAELEQMTALQCTRDIAARGVGAYRRSQRTQLQQALHVLAIPAACNLRARVPRPVHQATVHRDVVHPRARVVPGRVELAEAEALPRCKAQQRVRTKVQVDARHATAAAEGRSRVTAALRVALPTEFAV